MNWKELFPQFQPELLSTLEKEAVEKTFLSGEVIMRTGQYIKSTVIVLSGRIKIYRENEGGGEFLIYYIGPGEACAMSLICANLPTSVRSKWRLTRTCRFRPAD